MAPSGPVPVPRTVTGPRYATAADVRRWLEVQGQSHVLAVSANEYVWACLPEADWESRACWLGAKGVRLAVPALLHGPGRRAGLPRVRRPAQCDSGQFRGQHTGDPRSGEGDRAQVRTALYMATLTAIRYNPVIRKSCRHLCAVGKPKKVALIAAVRKLLTILNAMIKAQKPWSKTISPYW